MSEITNILVVGVGGQGIMTATEILAGAAIALGHDVKKTDWTPLDGRPVTVWAPAKTGAVIKNRLSEVVLLDIHDRPSDWGLADAQNAGIEIVAFIEACLRSQASGRWEDVAALPA